MFMVTLFMALAGQPAVVAPTRIQAIGPKQDDPRSCSSDPSVKTPERSPIVVQGGIIVQGGLKPESGAEQIGPKQDDPRSPAQARPGDDNDPKASGGEGAVAPVAGRKLLAIGPKQDDPRAAGVVARPGDDTDPHAAAPACMPLKR
jgi:hypothetical protein